MQQKSTFAGIDISKLTLDVCVCQALQKSHYVINNEPEATRTFFVSLLALKACTSQWKIPVAIITISTRYPAPTSHKALGLIRGKMIK